MAVVAHQEESSTDDVLIWRYAASRAHAAAEEARARAQEAVSAAGRTNRGLFGALAPQVQRFVRGARIQRRGRAQAPQPPATPEFEVIQGTPGVWTPREWTPVVQPVSHALWAPEQERPWTFSPLTASLDDILLDAASVPLPAALLAYDDVLEFLQRLHGRGLTYGKVRAAAVEVDQEGRCTLNEANVDLADITARSRLDDLQAATWILVEATGGGRVVNPTPALDRALLEGLPLAARCLVEQTLAVEAGYRLTAARLRSDLAVAAQAFLQEDWEPGARAWLASAAAASGVELIGRSQATASITEEAVAVTDDPPRRLMVGGIARREPRLLVGLGIAASASITLAVGAAVGITGSRPPAHATVAERPAILAPVSVEPRVNATPAALAPATPQPATPVAATPVPSPPPTAAPVHAAPPPVTIGPITFTPFPSPAATAPPTPTPTPACLLGIIC